MKLLLRMGRIRLSPLPSTEIKLLVRDARPDAAAVEWLAPVHACLPVKLLLLAPTMWPCSPPVSNDCILPLLPATPPLLWPSRI